MLEATLLALATLAADRQTGLAPVATDPTIFIPDRGFDLDGDTPSGSGWTAWSQSVPGRSTTVASLLNTLRAHDALVRKADGARTVGPSGGLAGSGIAINWIIPSTSYTPVGLTDEQVDQALAAVSDYLAAIIADPHTINVQLAFQPLPATSVLSTSNRTVVTCIVPVVDRLREGTGEAALLPALAGSVFPVRYNGLSWTITNENRIYMSTANARVVWDACPVGGPAVLPTYAIDAKISVNFNLPWDHFPEDGLDAPGGALRYSLQDHLIRELVQVLGWTSGTDALRRDMTVLDLYRFPKNPLTPAGIILDPDAADYNPGNHQGNGAELILRRHFGLGLYPAISPGPPPSYFVPDTIGAADEAGNADGILDPGEGDTHDTLFPRLVSKNAPNNSQLIQLCMEADGALADRDIGVHDGIPVRGCFLEQFEYEVLYSRYLMHASLPKGTTFYSRAEGSTPLDPLPPLGFIPDFLTLNELQILRLLGWTVDVPDADETGNPAD